MEISKKNSEFEAAIKGFLQRTGFGDSQRIKLADDASTRSYERLVSGEKSAILMKAPSFAENPPCPVGACEQERHELGWNALARLAGSRVEAFVAIAQFLSGNGFSAPEIYAYDIENGLAIIEDLGDNLFANILKHENEKEENFYAVAGETLGALHQISIPKYVGYEEISWPILDYDRLALQVNFDLFTDWVPKYLGIGAFDADIDLGLKQASAKIIEKILAQPKAFTLRDYHAENILWLPQRKNVARIGLLDFQDAVNGFRAWDFTMLLHDARRDVSKSAHKAAIKAYVETTQTDIEALKNEIEIQGAINIMRIIGIFSRLIIRDKKPKYQAFMPRMFGHLKHVLQNPSLAEFNKLLDDCAPLKGFIDA